MRTAAVIDGTGLAGVAGKVTVVCHLFEDGCAQKTKVRGPYSPVAKSPLPQWTQRSLANAQSELKPSPGDTIALPVGACAGTPTETACRFLVNTFAKQILTSRQARCTSISNTRNGHIGAR